MRRFSLLLVGLLAVSLAHAVEPAAGRYRLRVSEESARNALLTGKAAPKAKLALRADGTFDLQSDGAVRHGRYRIDEATIVLTTDNGDQFRGALKDGTVVLEGLAFERVAPQDPCGTWTVRRNGLEDRSMRMELKKDGTFRFVMTGATSEGTWTIVDGAVALVWTKIDGDAVEAGTVHKNIPIDEEGVSIQIDTYRYERSSN